MENSNTLPVIEVGDTVIFRTDLSHGETYGTQMFKTYMMEFMNHLCTVSKTVCESETKEVWYFEIVEDGSENKYSPEMVAQVIKPTKERVYTESEVTDILKSLERNLAEELKLCSTDAERSTSIASMIVKAIESLNK